jgi:hypothetical protein
MQWSYRPAGSVCRPTRRTAPESIPWGSPHVVSLAASSNVEPLVCQAHPALGGPSVETDCGWNSSMRVRPRFLSRATAIGCPAFFVRFHVCIGVSWQSVDASEKLRARPLTAMQPAGVGEVCSLSKMFNLALAPSTKSSDAMRHGRLQRE